MTGIREAQDEAWANKEAKGFNLTDVPLEFCLLQREMSEAFTAWREGSPDLGSELADVFIYTAGLAEMTGVDLAREVAAKQQVNQSRTYVRLPNGTPVKQPAPEGELEPEA
jgi:NTP pyrophosphatase (non-canonical NTP hydrolase)